MKSLRRYCPSLLFALLLFAGCDRPAPVELIDRDLGPPEVELLNEPPAPMLGTDDIDANGLFPADPRKAFAHMMISGSVYDGVFLHSEATLARAVFFDRFSPVVGPRGDTLAYHTIDVGTLSLDGDELRKHPKRLVLSQPPVDTALGVQYSLKSGAGSAIAFEGSHLYRWRNPVTTLPAPIDASVESPEAIVVTEPSPANKISLARNLPVRWRGGAAVVKIVISDVRDAGRVKPLVRMRVRRNLGGTVIPSAVLGMLPKGRAGFLFTFSSERSSLIRVAGFADDVLVQGVTSHSLYIQCSP